MFASGVIEIIEGRLSRSLVESAGRSQLALVNDILE